MGNNTSLRALLIGGCALVVALSTQIRAQDIGPYVDITGGASLAEDLNIHKFVVPFPSKVEFDPGFRLGVAGGYNFTPFLGAELETGFIYNKVKDSSLNGGDMSLSHVPLMANVVLRYDVPSAPWVVYGTAGGGGDVSIINLDQVVSPTGSIVDGTDATVRFAWQAGGGIRFKLTENMSLGAAYKYYWVDTASWDLESPGGKLKDAIQIGHAKTHNVMVDFNIKF